MNEFLIQKETLTNIADKFRDYLYEVGDNTHMIDPQFRPTYEDQLAEGAVNFTFYEQFDAAGYPADQGTYPDGSKDGGFLMCGMRRNDKGHLVPVIISGGMVDNQEEDYSAYYYVGIDVVEGVTYDKWRRIEGVDINTGGAPNPDENYMWESPFRSYLYTNRIVVPVGENVAQYNPTDFDTKVDDVYKAGAASATGEGDIQLPELVNPGTSSDLLSGKQLIDGEGNIVEGTIVTKTSSDLSSRNRTVTVPAGYYASQVTKTIVDTKLLPTNIRKGVSIFGTTGTMKPYDDGVIDLAPLYIQQNAPSTNLDSNYGNAQGVYSWSHFDNKSVGTVTYDINSVLVDEITEKTIGASLKVTNNNPYLWATVYVMLNHAYGTATSPSLEYRYASLVVGPGASVSKMLRGSGGFDGYHNWSGQPSYVKWSTTEPVATSEISE